METTKGTGFKKKKKTTGECFQQQIGICQGGEVEQRMFLCSLSGIRLRVACGSLDLSHKMGWIL